MNLLRYFYYRLRRAALFGKRFACPVCGGTYRRFLWKGDPPRKNAMCPKCFSLERHRLLWLYLEGNPTAKIKGSGHLQKSARVLHFAPEPSFEKRIRARSHLSYLTADLQPGRADEAFDITAIPHPNHRFDLILCNHVLEHIANDRLALQELFRVLSPGGTLLVQIPLGDDATQEDASILDPQQRRLLYGQEDHVRLYGLDFAERPAAVGFKVEVLWPWKQILPAWREKFRLAPEGEEGEPIFVCTKPAGP